MTSQETNRREGGSSSCPGRCQKLPIYTEKELETAWAAPELLGAPTIGGGSPGPGGVVEGIIEAKKAFKAARNI
jgi:hypothetical protein